MKKLTYKDLPNMIGETVLVKDHEYGNQICVVTEIKYKCSECKNTYTEISLENEEFNFDYNADGTCFGGEFEVYVIDGE